jgi:hypothetical protein
MATISPVCFKNLNRFKRRLPFVNLAKTAFGDELEQFVVYLVGKIVLTMLDLVARGV